MTEPRIAPLGDDELDDAARAALGPVFAAGRPWNVFRTMANHPELFRRWQVFANHVLFKSTLSPRERELAIVRIGLRCDSRYEVAQHDLMGAEAGLTEIELARIRKGPTDPDWSELDRLILQATDELFDDHRISDQTWAGLNRHYDTHQCMDLVFAVGQYTMVSMALRTFGVPLDDFLDEPEMLPSDGRG